MTEQDAAEIVLKGFKLVRCPNWREKTLREDGTISTSHYCVVCNGREVIVCPEYEQACVMLGINWRRKPKHVVKAAAQEMADGLRKHDRTGGS